VEIPIASPKDCFPIEDVERTVGPAKLPTYYEKEGFELDTGLQYLKVGEIKAILEKNNISKIRIKFDDAKIEKLPYIRIENHIENRKSKPLYGPCLRHIDNSDFIIVEMLKAKPTYEFIKQDGLKFGLTSSILSNWGIDGKLTTGYQLDGEYTLKSTSPFYLGYKTVRLVSNISDNEKTKGINSESETVYVKDMTIKAEELTLNEIKELKAESR
jgi:hypothetical protein